MSDNDKGASWFTRLEKRLKAWSGSFNARFGWLQESKGYRSSLDWTAKFGFERENITPPETAESIRGMTFEPLSARVYYDPKTNRYVERDTGQFIDYNRYDRELSRWRDEHLEFVVALKNPDASLTDRQAIEGLIKSLREDESITEGERDDYIGALLGS